MSITAYHDINMKMMLWGTSALFVTGRVRPIGGFTPDRRADSPHVKSYSDNMLSLLMSKE